MSTLEQRLVALGSAARNILNKDVDPEVSPLAPQEFIRQVSQRGASPERKLWLLAPLAAAFVLAAWVFWLPSTVRDVSYSGVGVTEVDGTISAQASAAGALRFSDGSRVTLQPAARVRVLGLSPHGATLELREGTAEFAVQHQADTAWSVRSGPFTIRVTGTRFDTSWSESTGRFELKLHEGSVVVSGGQLLEPQVLQPGQTFSVFADEKRRDYSSLGESVSPEGDVLPSDQSELGPPIDRTLAPPVSPEPASGSRSAPSASDWSRLLTDGKFEDVLKEAEARGLQQCLSACSLAELRALADAARYSSKLETARQSLQAQRKRFVGSAAATTALFLLGRVEEQAGHTTLAKQWYARYLQESPEGSLAPEAKSRLNRLLGDP